MGQEMRDRFCFTVYCALLADYEQEEAWNRLLAFNDGFKQPLPYPTLKQMMSSATEKKYRLTNEWVIEKLEINDDEMATIGLSHASEERSERMSRNYTRDLIRKSLREDRDNKILSLFSAGMSKSAIARELALSWNTVAKVIAMLWENYGKLPLIGHKDIVATACPGRWYDKLGKLEEMANVIYNGGELSEHDCLCDELEKELSALKAENTSLKAKIAAAQDALAD
jgi:hypothetical protein